MCILDCIQLIHPDCRVVHFVFLLLNLVTKDFLHSCCRCACVRVWVCVFMYAGSSTVMNIRNEVRTVGLFTMLLQLITLSCRNSQICVFVCFSPKCLTKSAVLVFVYFYFFFLLLHLSCCKAICRTLINHSSMAEPCCVEVGGCCQPPHLWDTWTALPHCYTPSFWGLFYISVCLAPHPTGKRLYINKWKKEVC